MKGLSIVCKKLNLRPPRLKFFLSEAMSEWANNLVIIGALKSAPIDKNFQEAGIGVCVGLNSLILWSIGTHQRGAKITPAFIRKEFEKRQKKGQYVNDHQQTIH